MYTDLVKIGLAFIEGFALIISPCILPILPIILSGSLTGNKSRPLGIVIGFILSFTVITLFSRALIQAAHIDPETLRVVSLVLLFLLGLMMLSTHLSEKFNLFTQRLTNVGSSNTVINNPEGGLWSGLLFGCLIGIIWTPCAGPILAAVIVQIVTEHTTFNSSLTVVAFALGAGVPMLLIALVGRKVLDKFGVFKKHADLFRKVLGLIIILTVVYLYYFGVEAFSFSSSPELTPTELTSDSLIDGLKQPYPAPNISGIDAWINSPPLKLSELKGKVVLIDFWTYSCINCIRTLPYIKDWYKKYHDKGLVIIGVHSPEFQFEHDINNVKTGVTKFGILYPVAIDNKFVTWRNFNNEFWPAHYLIDKNGNVVYEHFGEGSYAITENNIRYLLGLTGKVAEKQSNDQYSSAQTPETYLGYYRATNFSSPESVTKNAVATYSYPSGFALNNWALSGKWKIMADKIVAADKDAAIRLHFQAGKVYAVMGVTEQPVNIKVLFNDKPVNSVTQIKDHILYTLLEFPKETEGTITIIADAPGLELYTFTFGM